ncbi:MAG: GNAT family N-acetyltransferase [Anaerolineales bacterium]|nr:GNAT family N-acetyltransferase [Anaerolineales bacterium]
MTQQLFVPEPFRLRDGTTGSLRLLRPDDTERLKAFFYRLSPESIFYRILEYRTILTDEEARRLCDVDGIQRVAIAATYLDNDSEQIIGVARYGLIDPNKPDTAEAAVIVEDAFQGRGLGKLLVKRLVEYALTHGVRRFIATIHVNNAKILQFIQHSGLKYQRTLSGGTWEVVVHLDSPAGPNGVKNGAE